MKKLIVVTIAVVVSLTALMFVRHRMHDGMFFASAAQMSDLVVVNDSADSISVEFKDSGNKDVDTVLKPGDQVTGAQGFIKIFTAQKAGVYELTYAFPRPADTPQQVTLSQIVAAAHNEKLEDELLIDKGMIGDIKVVYEQARELD
jgi:hypothetical protein